MRSTRKDALTAGGIVFGLAIAGIAVFLYSGSSNAVLFFVAGVPVILILGGLAWHRRETRSSNATSPRIESMTEDLADDLEELLATYERLDRETPWDPSPHAEQIRDIRRDLENRGFRVHTDGDAHRVEVVDYEMGVGALSRHRQNVDMVLEDGLREGFRESVEAQTDEMNDQLARLVEENLLEESAAEEIEWLNAAGQNARQLTETLNDRRETFRDLLGEAVARVHEVSEDAYVDRSALDECVQEGRYADAVDLLLEVDVGEGGLRQKRTELSQLIDAAQSSVATQYAPQSRFDKLDALESELSDLDSVYQLDHLENDLRPKVLSVCAEIVSDLEAELTGYLETFSDPDVPRDYFERPPVLERSLTAELRDASNLSAFRTRWRGIVDDLSSALEEAGAREGALLAYDDVESEVERILAAEGEVTARDVPYDPAAPIMQLYAHRHEGVAFLESRPALTQGADVAGQEFDLTVDVRLDPPETRDVTVEAEIRDEHRRLTKTIDGSGTVEFDPLLGGEAIVTASADDSRFATRETDVVLDRDRTVEVMLTEETAIDRLCGGMRSDAELLFEEVAGEISATYDSEQYLTDEMDIGVQEEYRPCVLALYADDAGLSVREEADTVLVYDRRKLENQLTDLIEKKVKDDGEMRYEDIRDRFLRVPASDDLIRDIITQADLDVDVECADEKVVSA
ncbi:hypothetical protein [Halobellus sp. GM3]|uniref:hypothetical protein n=1 Tax=Halobellus sp. GM3 TaxID=3458410 RepID=UPI00403DEDDB